MADTTLNKPMRFALAVLVGVALGAALGWSVIHYVNLVKTESEPEPPKPVEASMYAAEPNRVPVKSGTIENEAWHYAQAVQRGDWDDVMRRVPWMLERLTHAELNEGGQAARDAAREELIARMEDRSPSSVDNQLLAEGVEDWFVFSPYCTMAAESVDAGRRDLEAPADSRTWIRVTYDSPITALRDSLNLPIHSLLAGVNTSASGGVLKANVIGNLDIDLESIQYFAGPGAASEPGGAGHEP